MTSGLTTGAVIVIQDMTAWAIVGVHDHERDLAQPLRMQLEIELPSCPATVSDRLDETVDYGAIVTDVREWLRETRFLLLERLADALIERIFTRYGAWRVSAQVMKGPILDGVGAVGIRLERLAPTLSPMTKIQHQEESRGNGYPQARPVDSGVQGFGNPGPGTQGLGRLAGKG